jgi:LacI family transcriptional regulator
MTAAIMARKNDFDEYKVITTDYTFEDGYRMVLEELKKGVAFDAIFANDVLCMGAMKALWESGVNVPKQVGVVGFDDIPSCAYLTPTLTSVRIDKKALGASAVELLLGKIAGGAADKVMIGAQLIQRGSTTTKVEQALRRS